MIEWKAFKNTEIVATAVCCVCSFGWLSTDWVYAQRSIFTADGGEDSKTGLTTGEPLITSMKPNADPADIPVFKKPRKPLSAYELWQLHKKQRDLRKGHLDQWESTVSQTGTGRPIDALICPVAPYAAVPHGEARSAMYTIPWNFLDYPVLVIPVTRVDPEVDIKVAREYISADDEDIDRLCQSISFSRSISYLQQPVR